MIDKQKKAPSARSKAADQRYVAKAELGEYEKAVLRSAVEAGDSTFESVALIGFRGSRNWARLIRTAKEKGKGKSPIEYARRVLLA